MGDLFSEFGNVPIKPTVKPTTTAEAKSSPAVVPNTTEKKEHHPTQSTPYKIEKAYTTSSAGGEITEGCIEHYSERIIAIDEKVEEEYSILSDLTDDNIDKYIIMGEILRPKF